MRFFLSEFCGWIGGLGWMKEKKSRGVVVGIDAVVWV